MVMHIREQCGTIKFRTVAQFALCVFVLGGLYQVTKKITVFRYNVQETNPHTPLFRNDPETSFLGSGHEFSLDVSQGSPHEAVKQGEKPVELPAFIKEQRTTQNSPQQAGSLQLMKSWKPQDIIGRSQYDPLLIAYIATQIHPIPPLIMPYNLTNSDMKDFSEKNQTTEVKKLLKEKVNGIFFEVGAYDGETFSNTLYWEREYGWTGLLIEPDPLMFKKLLNKHRKAFALQASLCPTNVANMTTFHTFPTDPRSIEPGQSSKTDVPCYPFYSVMAALDFPPIDYFSLDVNGRELAILRTIPFNGLNIRMVMVNFRRIPEGFDGLRKFMEGQGYKVKNILESDGIFVKNGVTLSA